MLNVPKTLAAGDSVAWMDAAIYGSNGPYNNVLYGLSFVFRGPGQVDATATPVGSTGFRTVLTGTGALVPGNYFWQAYLTEISTGQRLTIADGVTTVKPNLALVSTAYDGRSVTQKHLDAVNAAIAARLAGKVVQEYQIMGRSTRYSPLSELYELRKLLHTELNQAAQAKRGRQRKFVRFSR